MRKVDRAFRSDATHSDTGLPPVHVNERTDGKVWLFTCCACGRRWANPVAVISGCGCGGDVVAHTFPTDTYRRLVTEGRV